MRPVVLVAVLTGACAGYQPPLQTYPLPEARLLAAPTDSLWSAIVDVATERQFVVKLIDRASGFLQSERLVTQGSAYWDCGLRSETRSHGPGQPASVATFAIADEQPIPVTLTISAVPQGAAQSRVRVSANVGTTPTGDRSGRLARCVSKGVLEAELLDAIASRWQELRR